MYPRRSPQLLSGLVLLFSLGVAQLRSGGSTIDRGFTETIILHGIPPAQPGRVRLGTPEVVVTGDSVAHVLCPHHKGIRYFRQSPKGTTFTELSNLPFNSLSCFIGKRQGDELVCVFADSGGVKMLRKAGSSWIPAIVPTSNYTGGDLSAAIDSTGRVSVVVTEAPGTPVIRLSSYTWSETGGWSHTIMKEGNDFNFADFHDAGYDKNDTLHVIYQTGWTMVPDIGINHISRLKEGVIQEETIADQSNLLDMHLSFDGSSRPIVLFHGSNSNLTFAVRNESNWNVSQFGEPPNNWPPIQNGAIGALPDSDGKGMVALVRFGITQVRPRDGGFEFSSLDETASFPISRASVAIAPNGSPVYAYVGGMTDEGYLGILRDLSSFSPLLAISRSEGAMKLEFDNLIPGQNYRLFASPNLQEWILDSEFSANSPSATKIVTSSSLPSQFFRMAWDQSNLQVAEPASQ